jgi:hypothetical protein
VAQHFLTFLQLKDEAEHAIGGSPDTRTSSDRIVNGAVEYLCNIHPWSWREGITTLSFAQDEGRIPLPEDFGELVSLIAAARVPVRKATARAVMAVRTLGTGIAGGGFIYYVSIAPPADPQTPPLRCIEIAPIPAAAEANALHMTYRRLIPALEDDADVPAIPIGMFELLRVLVRAMAVSTEEQQGGHDWELFRQMLANYIHADAIAGGHESVMRDVLGDGECLFLAPHTEIRFPGDP